MTSGAPKMLTVPHALSWYPRGSRARSLRLEYLATPASLTCLKASSLANAVCSLAESMSNHWIGFSIITPGQEEFIDQDGENKAGVVGSKAKRPPRANGTCEWFPVRDQSRQGSLRMLLRCTSNHVALAGEKFSSRAHEAFACLEGALQAGWQQARDLRHTTICSTSAPLSRVGVSFNVRSSCAAVGVAVDHGCKQHDGLQGQEHVEPVVTRQQRQRREGLGPRVRHLRLSRWITFTPYPGAPGASFALA